MAQQTYGEWMRSNPPIPNLTAVEWLTQQVKSKEWQDMFIWHKEEIFKQAKQMEKEQMLEFYGWMKENDTADNAEKYFHYSDEDMLNEYFKK